MNSAVAAMRIFAVGCLIGLLTSCGGGSSGGGSSDSDLTACLNFSALPPPALNYTGNTSAGTLDKSNALPIAARSMSLLLQLANVIPTLPLDVTVSQESCFNNQSLGTSGTLKSTTLIQTNQSGWSDFEYKNYTGNIALGFFGNVYNVNGNAYAVFSPAISNNLQVNETISLTNFHVVIPTYMDVSINGTINLTVVRVNATSPFHIATPVNANVVIVDNLNKTTTWANNFKYVDTASTSIPQFDYSRTLSGRIYDSSMGYADILTISPIWYYIAAPLGGYPFQYSDGGGPIKFTSSSPSVAYLTPLNTKLFSVAIDSVGNGLLATAERLNWADMQPDTTPWPNLAGPVPFAAINQMTSALVVGQPLPLEGLRSYDPSGGYVTFAWSETYATPGSLAVLTNTTSATPSFIPDLPGDYRFQLTVSNGVSSNSDEIVATVLASPTGIVTYDNVGITGPNLQTHVGQTVTLDNRASRDYVPGLVDNPDIVYLWTLLPPPGSNAQLSYPSSDKSIAQFTPDIPGFYLADLEADTSSVSEPIMTQQVIAVDTPVDFHKPVTLESAMPGEGSFSAFAVGDFNNDGVPDIVIAPNNPIPSPIEVYYGTKSGNFTSSETINMPDNYLYTELEAKDVNNDGLTDIVIGPSPYVLLQQANGTLSGLQQIGASSTCANPPFYGVGLFAIGPWMSAITNSIYTEAADNCLDIYNNISPTQFTSSGTFPLSGDYTGLSQIIKISGDSLADLLVFNEPSIGNDSIDLLQGQSDGSFITQASYPIPRANADHEFVVADFNHDTLQDVAVMAENNVDVLLQTSSGTFSPIVQYPLFSLGSAFYPSSGLSAGDLNNDGYDDLIDQHLAYNFPDPSNYYNNSYVSYLGLLMQNANQTFNSEMLYPFRSGTSQDIFNNSTQIVDLNNDGLPDVIMYDGSGNLIILYQKPVN